MKRFSLVLIGLLLVIMASAQEIRRWKIADLERYLEQSETPVVINFWATFCKPCVEEIPWFQEIAEKYKGQKVKLLLVSLDLPFFYPAKIQAFAQKHHFNAEIVWLDETNADVFCPKIDPSWSGAIPATLFLNNKTKHRKFFETQMKAPFFEARLKDAIGLN